MRGRGHGKIEQDGVTRHVSDDGVVRLPKSIKDLGVALNQDVKIVLVKSNTNPLDWEVKIKPIIEFDPPLEK